MLVALTAQGVVYGTKYQLMAFISISKGGVLSMTTFD